MVGEYHYILSILLLIAALVSLYLGVIVFRAGNAQKHRWFFVVAVSSAVWAMTNVLFAIAPEPIRTIAALMSYGAAASLAIGFLEFCFSIVEKKMSKALQQTFLSIGLSIVLISIIPGVLLVRVTDDLRIETRFVSLVFYGLFLASCLLRGVAALISSYKTANQQERRGIAILMVGLSFGATLGVLCNLLLPMIGNYSLVQVGPLGILIFIGVSFYAIARHGLFDIKAAAVRTIGYTLTLSVMAGVYMILAYGASVLFFGGTVTDGVGLSPTNSIIAILLAFLFQPIKHFFDQLTNKMFYRGQYDQGVFFREFGRILSYDTDLRLLLRQTSQYISSNLNAEKVFFSIIDRGVFGVGITKGTRPLATDIEMIGEYYRSNHEFPAVLVVDMMKDKKMQQILAMYQIYMVLPLILRGKPIGYLFIGEHKSRGYTLRDIKVIETIANELAIAVQNSLSVEEIRELNESLKNKVDTATKELRASNRQLQRLDEAKNEFISMASHQLRTPLTSIKGYLDMILEGDLGKVSATQKAVLSEAFVSSERMVTLINDFLNVSRLQTGKFVIDRTESDLKEVLKDQIQMVQGMAKQHDLNIKEAIDKDIPYMYLDIEKLRQVMMNFIDNAIYYSKPGTTIYIKLKKEKGYILFSVKDTGIGVPKSEQSQLFGRFFRASNARKRRPDGTGVGLFLAKKVVLLHGGQVVFESEEGKGSVFGFRLPIDQPKTSL